LSADVQPPLKRATGRLRLRLEDKGASHGVWNASTVRPD